MIVPSGNLVVRDPQVLCHRCHTQVARTRATQGEEWQLAFPAPRLLGTGWHIGRDGVWRSESKVRSRARDGKQPLASHHRAVMTIYTDKIGWDPATSTQVLVGEPSIEKTAPRGVEGYVSPESLVECPNCGAVSRFDPPRE